MKGVEEGVEHRCLCWISEQLIRTYGSFTRDGYNVVECTVGAGNVDQVDKCSSKIIMEFGNVL